MAQSEGPAPPAEPRSGLARWLPDLLVLTIVLLAFSNLQFNWSEHWLGIHRVDAAQDPALVAPPEGLRLPETARAAPVAAASIPGRVDPSAVATALAPYADDPLLGRHVDVYVSELGSGRIVYRHGGGSVTPASTTKLLTSAAALESLGPNRRFRTTVRQTGHLLTLVGGGDPFLMSDTAAARGLYPRRATLDRLAQSAASKLIAQGVRRVRLGYDDSLFTGPAVNPAWPAAYLPEFVVPPITSLWVDEATGSGVGYVADPSAAAADVFRSALIKHGIRVAKSVAQAVAPARSAELTVVESAPLAQIVERTLAVSDNNAAEVLGHQVGLAERADGSFAGGVAGVRDVLQRLGLPMLDERLYDGSGLSRQDRLTPATLLAVLRLAASPQHPELRAVLTGLPVAGFPGSLESRFDDAPTAALGRVRAKTGTLTGVHGLAGVVTDAAGHELAFVAIADRVKEPDTVAARATLVKIAAALGRCHC